MKNVMTVNTKTLSTRQKAKRLVQEAHASGNAVLDLSNVEFMTRSVADELRYFEDQGEIELQGLRGPVREMYQVVCGSKLTA